MKKTGYSMTSGIKKLGAGNSYSFLRQIPNAWGFLNKYIKLNVNCFIRGIPAQYTIHVQNTFTSALPVSLQTISGIGTGAHQEKARGKQPTGRPGGAGACLYPDPGKQPALLVAGTACLGPGAGRGDHRLRGDGSQAQDL